MKVSESLVTKHWAFASLVQLVSLFPVRAAAVNVALSTLSVARRDPLIRFSRVQFPETVSRSERLYHHLIKTSH